MVFLTALLAATAEGLTRRPTGDEVDRWFQSFPTDIFDVLERDGPLAHVVHASLLVMHNCGHSVPIKLGHQQVFEARSRHAKRKPSAASKEFSASHLHSLLNRAGAWAHHEPAPKNLSTERLVFFASQSGCHSLRVSPVFTQDRLRSNPRQSAATMPTSAKMHARGNNLSYQKS
jgi:hypothetical protein